MIKIFTVDSVEAERIKGTLNKPHAHPFEALIIGVVGQLEHFIDFKTTIFEAPFISFVPKGKVHRVKPLLKDGNCKMWVLRFKSEFIPDEDHQPLTNFSSQGRAFQLSIPSPEHYLLLLYSLALKDKNETITLYNDKPLAGSLTMTSLKIDRA